MRIISENLLQLPGYNVQKIYTEGKSIYTWLTVRKKPRCIHCKNKRLRIKDTKERKIRHENFSDRRVYLILKARKYYCPVCHKYFWERFPGVYPYHNKTEPFRKQVAHLAFRGVTKKDISVDYDIGQATAYRYFLKELHLRSKHQPDYPCPKVLGIDEHFFTRKQGYATTFCDLSKHKVYDVVLGRSEKALESYLRTLKGRERVQVIVMDLSETYRHIARKYFPYAKIVSDRFHVIRLVNHHFLKIWGEIDPVGRKNRGLLSLMRRDPKNLSSEQASRLHRYLKAYPALRSIYEFKQRLCKLLTTQKQTARQCRRLIPIFLEYVAQLKASMLNTLGNTLESWSEEVVRMWRFTKSNGITEGYHNKMKMLVRRAYGFRNFENYRLWVKILCR